MIGLLSPEMMSWLPEGQGCSFALLVFFSALLLAQQYGSEYKRIVLDNHIIAQVRDMTFVDDMVNVRMLDIV
ncbi:uncharacterized protein F5891DRAFT_1034204 [Suillus fuscotomentosus]|uniref:Uncharacterized protein n=1 Tax=Suillus fuscotomentosus TaxID=1912939 RepID=A0AAD4E662_9AGAM|nr:uncharacterized protein F5891DRAFT_1034204 [Suillus fuscotomentosus]KAG1900458.1 hypothetical protein F5891DRAFT_1034204 [Suillus fuscotomentosus]